MIRAFNLKYNLDTEDITFLQSLIGHQLWRFRYNSNNMLGINYANSIVLELLYSGIGVLIFMKNDFITIMKVHFPVIEEQDLTYDLCSMNLSFQTFDKNYFFQRNNHEKHKIENNRSISITNVPVVQKIELYGIENNDYVYDSYEQITKKEVPKIIDINIDIFLVFYLSNKTTLLLDNNGSTGGCSLVIMSLDDLIEHLALTQEQRYEGFNITLKKVFS